MFIFNYLIDGFPIFLLLALLIVSQVFLRHTLYLFEIAFYHLH
ncbi:TPA: Loki-CTERM sorting domain-containing protein [Staphylococcus aureus]